MALSSIEDCSEQRVCRLTGDPFTIAPIEREICRELAMPLPTLHPRERMRRLAGFNNYFNLFPGKCAASGDRIIQMFRPKVPFPVYSMPVWWGDSWDALSYGRDYDFSRSFFDQFRDLQDAVPQAALSVNYLTNENCEYVNGMSYSKNCYLCFLTVSSEDCLYCNSVWRSRDCIDCTSSYDCELCSDLVFVSNGYNLHHAFNSSDCRDSYYLWNCIGCQDCFGCVNLRHARYCYFNEQLSPENYRSRLAAFASDNYAQVEELREKFISFARTFPQPAIRGAAISDSTGDFLNHTSNVIRSFDCAELEDSANCLKVVQAKNCLDIYSWGYQAEFNYNCSRIGTSASRLRCCYLVYNGTTEVEYSMTCFGCKDCFGCVGLKHKQYCILNRQYSKDQYFDLKHRIIRQMDDSRFITPDRSYGEYFPFSNSLVDYNDSDAGFFFPAAKDEALRLGGSWNDDQFTDLRSEACSTAVLPAAAGEMGDEYAAKAYRCEQSGRAFRYTKKELESYRSRRLPAPRFHWKVRMELRSRLANLPELYSIRSEKSGIPVESSFAPASGWKVWLKNEYEEEVSS